MRTFPLRLLGCSVLTLCLVSCAFAQAPPDDSDVESQPNVQTQMQLSVDAPTLGSLNELERMALATNPAIAKAYAVRDALTGKRLQAGLGPNPTAGIFGEDINEEGRGGRYGVFYGKEIVRGNKLALSQNIVDAEINAACRQIEILERRLKTDVKNAFYEVLLAQQRVTLTDALVTRLAEIVKISEALVEAKEAAAASVLQVEIQYEKIKIVAAQTKLDLSGARQQLAALINESVLPYGQLDGDISVIPSLPPIEEVYDRLLGCSPEIAAELAKIETAEQTLSRAEVQAVPNVTWQTAFSYDTAGDTVIADFQVGMPLPTVNWNQGNIRKARSEIVVASASVEQKVVQLRQRLITNYRQYSQAKLQVDAFANSILPKSEKSLKLITAGYRAGELDFLQVLTAQRTFVQAQLDYLDRLRTLRSKAILVEGQLLNASLQ